MRRLDNVLDATNMIDDLYNAGREKQLDRVADTVTALRKSDRLVTSTGIRFMDNIDDFESWYSRTSEECNTKELS